MLWPGALSPSCLFPAIACCSSMEGTGIDKGMRHAIRMDGWMILPSTACPCGQSLRQRLPRETCRPLCTPPSPVREGVLRVVRVRVGGDLFKLNLITCFPRWTRHGVDTLGIHISFTLRPCP